MGSAYAVEVESVSYGVIFEQCVDNYCEPSPEPNRRCSNHFVPHVGEKIFQKKFHMGQDFIVSKCGSRALFFNAIVGLFSVAGCQMGVTPQLASVDTYRPAVAGAEFSSGEQAETVPMRDVRLTAELPMHNACQAAIPVRVTLTNVGNQQFSFAVATSLPKFVELLQPDGSLAPMTDYGKNNLGNIFATTVTMMTIDRDLSRAWEFDLHRLFRFSQPGPYRLKITQDVTFPGNEPDRCVYISLSNLRFYLVQKRE